MKYFTFFGFSFRLDRAEALPVPQASTTSLVFILRRQRRRKMKEKRILRGVLALLRAQYTCQQLQHGMIDDNEQRKDCKSYMNVAPGTEDETCSLLPLQRR